MCDLLTSQCQIGQLASPFLSVLPSLTPSLTTVLHRWSGGGHTFVVVRGRLRDGGGEGEGKGRCECDGHRELERINTANLGGEHQLVGDL